MPDGLKCIYDDAFLWCVGLKQITVPESVRYIGPNAFKHSGLNTITLYSKTEIDRYAFVGCDNLTNVVVIGDVNDTIKDAFRFVELNR